MARTIPWENPKDETRDSKFYVRQPGVLEARQPILNHTKLGKLVLPKNADRQTLKEVTLNVMPSGQKAVENQNDFDNPLCVQKQDLLSVQWSSSIAITQRQRWNNQSSKPGVFFPKQAFRSRTSRSDKKEEGMLQAELEIWRSTNEFGHSLLCYRRYHCMPVNIEC